MTDIIVDWGSTNFRAFLVTEGRIADRRVGDGHGVLQLHAQKTSAECHGFYSDILRQHLGQWLAQNPFATVFMCGAIGSREGWIDTGYNEAPAELNALARSLRFLTPEESGNIAGTKICILPGLGISRGGRQDMMRSEEIKSLGALFHLGLENGIFCIPGTHCKWVVIRNGKIVDFCSVLTGEVYNTMQVAGSLATLFPKHAVEQSNAAFDQGLSLAAEGQDLLADLWQVRSQKIRADYPEEHLHSYLSGILIGHEIRQAQCFLRNPEDVILLSDPGPRQDYYRRAIEKLGWRVASVIESETAVCTGMMRLIEAYRQQ